MQAVGLAQTQNHFIVLTGLFSNTVTYLFRYSAGQTWVSHRAVHTRELVILRFMQTGLTHGMRIKSLFSGLKNSCSAFPSSISPSTRAAVWEDHLLCSVPENKHFLASLRLHTSNFTNCILTEVLLKKSQMFIKQLHADGFPKENSPCACWGLFSAAD